METAIYLNTPGKQKEINADQITEKRQYRRGSFICPECGEDAMLRISDKQKSYFAHYMKNEFSRECDRRVDGETNLTIYERLGVPLYLTKSRKIGYELNIGLKSISMEALKLAEGKGSYLELKVRRNKVKRINISRINFFPEKLNLFKIENYPEYGEPFSIQYNNLPTTINKWADFIDSILRDGILFSIDSNVGKSIRHGDTIYSDEEYLWLSPRKLKGKSLLDKNVEFDGEVVLNNRPHYIYKIRFIKDKKDLDNFNAISNTLREKLKVILLESKNQINLIWPPGIKTEEGYSVSTKGRIHSVVHSVNTQPDIYAYSNASYKTPTSIDTTHYKDINYLQYNLSDTEIQLNMDRKITSTGIGIKYDKLMYKGKNIKVIENSKNLLNLYGNHISNDLDIKLHTDIKVNSIRVDTDKKIDVRKYENGNIEWRKLNYGDIIYLLNNENVIAKIKLNKPENLIKYSFKELERLSQLPQKKVRLTSKHRRMIYKIINTDKNYANFFQEYLITNSIPYAIHALLQEASIYE